MSCGCGEVSGRVLGAGRGGAGGCGCHDTVLVFFPAVVSTATENTVVRL